MNKIEWYNLMGVYDDGVGFYITPPNDGTVTVYAYLPNTNFPKLIIGVATGVESGKLLADKFINDPRLHVLQSIRGHVSAIREVRSRKEEMSPLFFHVSQELGRRNRADAWRERDELDAVMLSIENEKHALDGLEAYYRIIVEGYATSLGLDVDVGSIV